MTKFVLRTTDAAWIARNNGTVDDDGKVTVHVPADQVHELTICGKPWIRHRFTDIPKDCGNANILCPVAWVA